MRGCSPSTKRPTFFRHALRLDSQTCLRGRPLSKLNQRLLSIFAGPSGPGSAALNYPGMILGVRKNSSSCDWIEMVVRLKRFPINGKLPTRGTSEMFVFCVLTMIPPITTVPPSGTRTLVCADCVSSAGIPCTRGIP